MTDQSVALGDSVLRSYTPAKTGQKQSVINIYSSESSDVGFITDKVSDLHSTTRASPHQIVDRSADASDKPHPQPGLCLLNEI